MRGRLTAYSAWQARDFAFERGFPMLVVSTIVLFPVVMLMRGMRSQTPEAPLAEIAAGALVQALPLLSFVLVILAVNGIVSNDRKRGYYRFLFAKPISLVRYYVQSFLVNAVGLLLVGAIVLGAFYLFAYPTLPWGALGFLAVQFLGLGGVIFLLSTLVRADWIFIAGIWMTSNILRALYPPDRGWHGELFHVVLPPTHVVDDVAQAMTAGTGLVVSDALWLAGYGAGAFALGLFFLARRPLAD